MKYPQASKVVARQVSADVSSPSTRLLTEWMLAAGAKTLLVLREARSRASERDFFAWSLDNRLAST